MFKDENQKNLILAIVISVAIVLGWQLWFEGPRLEKERAARQQSAEQQAAPATGAPPPAGAPVAQPGTAAAPLAAGA
ncbi:MAG: membrane protein insertase YidC, partial [Alphaproteobacteria bacterium]